MTYNISIYKHETANIKHGAAETSETERFSGVQDAP